MVRLERCCCGCCSVRTGSIILGWLSLVGSLINIGSDSAMVANISPNEENRETLIAVYACQISINCISTLTSVLLLHGIYKREPGWMIPYLISMMIQVIGNIMLSIIIFISLPLSMFASACISLILSTYFYIVVYSHYKDVQEETQGVHGYA